jgi:hypothetical protein
MRPNRYSPNRRSTSAGRRARSRPRPTPPPRLSSRATGPDVPSARPADRHQVHPIVLPGLSSHAARDRRVGHRRNTLIREMAPFTPTCPLPASSSRRYRQAAADQQSPPEDLVSGRRAIQATEQQLTPRNNTRRLTKHYQPTLGFTRQLVCKYCAPPHLKS